MEGTVEKLTRDALKVMMGRSAKTAKEREVWGMLTAEKPDYYTAMCVAGVQRDRHYADIGPCLYRRWWDLWAIARCAEMGWWDRIQDMLDGAAEERYDVEAENTPDRLTAYWGKNKKGEYRPCPVVRTRSKS